jgi:hypothetical protein
MGLALKKPDMGQALQAGSFLLCAVLALYVTRGLDKSEFRGGWLTGPLLSMADIGTVLFILALVLTLLRPRVAAGFGLASSLLCVPLCAFFIAPVRFTYVFARGHEFSVQPTPGLHWDTWSIATLLALAFAAYLCMRRFAASAQIPSSQ